MDSQRNFFFIAFLFVSFVIWQVWQMDHTSRLQKTQTTKNTTIVIDTSQEGMSNKEKSKIITVETDVLYLTITARGGDIIQASLINYLDRIKPFQTSQPFHLLETSDTFLYQAQSGLIGRNGPDNPNNGVRPLFKTTQNYFKMTNDQNELRIPMMFTAEDGTIYVKTFIFKRGEYAIDVEYRINNVSQKSLELVMFGQLKQLINLPKIRDTTSTVSFALQTFRGAAYSTKDEKYKKYKFNTIADNKNLDTKTHNGWVAMLQQYFATAWVPRTAGINTLYTNNIGDGIVAIGYKAAPVIVDPGSQQTLSATLWIGPEIQDKMRTIAPYLDLTVDYGWLWFISQPLFKLLKFLHSFIGNWGYSIIVITFIVRGIMYPLTKIQYTAIAKMRMLQPKIQEIRERIGDDKQRLSQEMMSLYKSERVNPLSGCLPLIIQMPIFLALYYMLIGSIELRHAPFVFWIYDLSDQDPYYILPILMGVTMFFIQKLSPTTITDPMQQKIIKFMPIIFTGFFLWFPSGLVLYYIISNIVTIFQQQIIYRSLEKHGLHSRRKKKI